eukprot:TRINITY_DN1849_c0_g1_i8.p1 TRINITY_DN1849_c0_g1~~TRINITY_DN1849_c0_g1_i8.p1  ORF type:complete len:477 (+),score=82.68 TRINITY_DN1849_c0_g1_i8:48-1478(+)
MDAVRGLFGHLSPHHHHHGFSAGGLSSSLPDHKYPVGGSARNANPLLKLLGCADNLSDRPLHEAIILSPHISPEHIRTSTVPRMVEICKTSNDPDLQSEILTALSRMMPGIPAEAIFSCIVPMLEGMLTRTPDMVGQVYTSIITLLPSPSSLHTRETPFIIDEVTSRVIPQLLRIVMDKSVRNASAVQLSFSLVQSATDMLRQCKAAGLYNNKDTDHPSDALAYNPFLLPSSGSRSAPPSPLGAHWSGAPQSRIAERPASAFNPLAYSDEMLLIPDRSPHSEDSTPSTSPFWAISPEHSPPRSPVHRAASPLVVHARLPHHLQRSSSEGHLMLAKQPTKQSNSPARMEEFSLMSGAVPLSSHHPQLQPRISSPRNFNLDTHQGPEDPPTSISLWDNINNTFLASPDASPSPLRKPLRSVSPQPSRAQPPSASTWEGHSFLRPEGLFPMASSREDLENPFAFPPDALYSTDLYGGGP